MFNSTHTLVGFAIGRTGLDRWSPYAVWTAVVASNLPDIDIVTQAFGTANYLDFHRGITHSFVGAPILALLLAAVVYKVSARRNRNASHFRKLFWIGLIAISTHLALDWANTYGVRPFLPFEGSWYYGDTLFIIDPFLDSILLVGVILGSRHAGKHKKAAILTFALGFAYLIGMLTLRQIATGQLGTYLGQRRGITKLAVAPQFMQPFRWTGLIETPADVSSLAINLLTGSISQQDRMPKEVDSPVTRAAQATRTGAIFLNFARFPVTRVTTTAEGYRVYLIDFRFFRNSPQTAGWH